jgi:hypothetical protein
LPAKQVLHAVWLPGCTARGDKYLGDIAQGLGRVLRKTLSNFALPSCRLPDAACGEVAMLLILTAA